jgi:nicotinate phosphoribosyltransferase
VSPATSLLTDHYELTMVEAALAAGTADRRSVFELFARRLPGGRRYGLLAGTGRVLEGLEDFRFGSAEIDYLAQHRVVNDDTLDWLANFRFSGSITGYAEGEIYFPGSPLLQVESTFAEAVLLETYLLSVLNFDSAVASAASRMVASAEGRPCIEMGSRRTHEEGAVAAARAAIIAGFASTSNLEAGRRYGLTTGGTAAHSFTLLHDSEREAFQAQVDTLGVGTTLLVDTYDVEQGVRTAVDVAGPRLGAVRIDSGDLVDQARWVRRLLDELGNTETGIVVTSDLDEYAIASLRSAPVDSYGVGTQLVTGSGHPTAGMVYKLVARVGDDGAWKDVAKRATGKASVGGRKSAFRRLNERGRATAEVIGVDEAAPAGQFVRNLLVPLVVDGEVQPGFTGAAGVERAIARREASIGELPGSGKQMIAGDPVIPTEYL